MFFIYSFFPHLFLSFILPGFLWMWVLLKRKEADLLLFLVYLAIFGIFSQIIIGLLISLNAGLVLDLRLKFLILALLFNLLPAIIIFWKKKILPKINVSGFDLLVLLIVFVFALFINSHVSQLDDGYFNVGSDQYHWLAYAERANADPQIGLITLFKDNFHRPFFYFLLSPQVIFLSKNLAAVQNFILTWLTFYYLLTALAISRLAATALSNRYLALLAPILFFALHWSNYYLLSTAVVPQNPAIFLLIMGFLLLKEKNETGLLVIYLLTFYAVHLATFAILILALGIARLFTSALEFCRGRTTSFGLWHFFEKIFFLLAVLVAIRYFLYAAGILSFYPLETISYLYEYGKDISLWDQPYVNFYQNWIIVLALFGAAGVLFPPSLYKKSEILPPVLFGFLLPWIFLKTPLIAYHAFYASWPSFRYFLILYPSLTILALVPLDLILSFAKNYLPQLLISGITVLLLIFLGPKLMNEVSDQQGFVFLDMIRGRDGGEKFGSMKVAMQELLLLNDQLRVRTLDPVVVISMDPIETPHVSWIFAPRPVLSLLGQCSLLQCYLEDRLKITTLQNYQVKPVLWIFNKNNQGKNLVDDLVLTNFHRVSTKDYSFYVAADFRN